MGLFVLADFQLPSGASVSATNVHADAPASRLLTTSPRDRMITTGTTTRVTLDLGASVERALVFVGYANVSATATIELWADDTEGNLFTGSAAFHQAAETYWGSTGDVDDWPLGVHYHTRLDPVQTHRYWGIEITDISNPNGVLQIGRVAVLDPVVLPAGHGAVAGWTFGPQEPPVRILSQAGGVSSRTQAKRLSGTCRIVGIPAATALGEVVPLLWRSGTSRPVLAVLDDEADEYRMVKTWYGHRAQADQPVRNLFTTYYDLDLTIEEP